MDFSNKIKSYIIHRINKLNILVKENINYYTHKSENMIILEGYADTINFGDALNYPIIEHFSNKKIVNKRHIRTNKQTFSCIGSIIQSIQSNSIVWGSGVISEDATIPKNIDIIAIRGPLSRRKIIESGIECPNVYGDPALLLPDIYSPKIEKKHKIGVIPHYIDLSNPKLEYFRNNPDYKIINVCVGRDYKGVVDDILASEFVISSSLHGLILANTYNVPFIVV